MVQAILPPYHFSPAVRDPLLSIEEKETAKATFQALMADEQVCVGALLNQGRWAKVKAFFGR